MTTFSHGRRRLATVSLAAALALTGFFGVRAATTGDLFGDHPRPTLKVVSRSESAAGRGYASVVKRVLPAVVNISTSRVSRMTSGNGLQDMDPLFRQLFGEEFGRRFNVPRERREKSLGSGVIVSPEGYILTNNHVIDGATSVQVVLSDRREFKARVIGKDDKTDVAVVKIDAGNLPAITIGDSERLQ